MVKLFAMTSMSLTVQFRIAVSELFSIFVIVNDSLFANFLICARKVTYQPTFYAALAFFLYPCLDKALRSVILRI